MRRSLATLLTLGLVPSATAQTSGPGYRYLGELLASRGFIVVPVDENFINGSLRGEDDGRAWLLLELLAR